MSSKRSHISNLMRFLSTGRRGRKRWPLLLALLALIFGPMAFLILRQPRDVGAAWFDDAFAYRARLTFGNTGAADTNKRVKFDIDTAALTTDKLQADCDDLRFTDINGKQLDYYIDSTGGACDTSSTDVYVLVPSIFAGENVIYQYYGNPSASRGGETSQFSEATFTPTSGPATAAEEKGPGPAAYWAFDEGQGQIVTDSSSNQFQGTLGANSGSSTDDPAWKTEDQCLIGKCLGFDGGDLVDTGKDFSFTSAEPYTFSVWINPKTLTGEQAIVGKVNFEYVLGLENGYPVFYYWNSGGASAIVRLDDTVITTTLTSTNTWYFLTVVSDGSSAKMYLDGTLIGTDSNISGTNENRTDTLKIGQSYTNFGAGGATRYFNGQIDELKIYPYARTAAQIKSDFLSRGGSNEGTATSFGAADQKFLSNGLVGYWKADEATWSGTLNEVVDSSGNGVHGTAAGATGGKAYPAAGKFGNSGFFDGVDDYVDVPGGTSITLGNDMTVAYWMKSSSTQQDPILSSRCGGCGGGRFYFGLTGNKAFLYHDGSSNPSVTSVTSVNNGVWRHIVFTHTGTSTKIYVDGVLDKSQTQTGYTSGAHALRIGHDVANVSEYYTGNVDEVRVYNRALSPGEVKSLYNFAPGPVGHWKLDEGLWNGTSNEVFDSSGNGNNGTAQSGATTAVGKVGKAGNLDGVDAHVKVLDNNFLDMAGYDFTLEAWIKPDTIGTTQAFIYKGGFQAAAAGYLFRVNTTGTLSMFMGNGTTNASAGCSACTISAGNWYHVAAVANRANNTISYYVNGVFKQTVSLSASITGSISSSHNLGIGRYADISNSPFDGLIDDVRIYNYPRTPGQIVEDMNADHPIGGSPIGSQLGYWKFDEQQGTVAHDATQHQNLTVTSATWRTGSSCKINGCLDFDNGVAGSKAFYDDVTSSIFDLTSNFSFGAWVYRTNSPTNQARIISKADKFLLYTGTNNIPLCHMTGLTPTALTGTTALPLNTWTHIMCTFSGTARKLYIDGKLDAQDTTTGSITPDNLDFVVGNYDTASDTYRFRGRIDEPKVYNTELTAEQVKLDMNAGSSLNFGATAPAEASLLTDGAGNPPVTSLKMDEKNGIVANDTSGNGRNATITGVTWAAGKFGSALQFNGSSDYANLTSTQDFNSSFSISVWAKLDANATSRNEVVTHAKGGWAGWSLYYTGSNYVFIIADSVGPDKSCTLATTPTKGEWHHLGVTIDQSGDSIKCYYDGRQANTTTTPTGTDIDSGNSVTIGKRDQIASYYFKGLIDNLEIYDYARTASQVAYDFNRGRPIAHWKLDECQGNTANDSSGNGYNGTITPGAGSNTEAGNCTSGDTADMWNDGATGKFGASLGFDGTDDWVNTADINSLDSASTFTISMWAKKSATGNLITLGKTSGNNNARVEVGFWSDGILYFIVANGSNSYGQVSFNDTNWHNIVMVFDGSQSDNPGRLKGYVDGKLQTLSFTGTIPSTSANHTGNFEIGRVNLGTIYYSAGLIDDVRVYNYALSASQIKQVMNEGSSVRYGN